MNFWYQSRPNEIFLDLDSRRSLNRAIHVLRLAVRAIPSKRLLHIDEIYAYPTLTRGHAHVIIKLMKPLPAIQRLAWAAWLGNDRLRMAYVLMRSDVMLPPYDMLLSYWGPPGDLLVSSQQYYRAPDAWCECKGKHKDRSVTDECQGMIHLLKEHRSADYFYRTGKVKPVGKIRIPWGKVSKSQLRMWTNGEREKRKK